MTIDRLGGDPTGAAKANRTARHDPISSSGERSEGLSAGRDRRDQVEISAEGRALSAGQGLDANRLSQIHERLDSGAYHTPEVAERLAQRLLPEMV